MNFKNITRTFFYSTISVGLLLSTACKKDKDGGGPVVDPTAKKLVKIEEDANNYVTFDYNTDGTVKALNSVEDGDPTTIQISYNANKTVKEVTTEEGSVIKYIYSNNQLAGTETYVEGELVAYTENNYQGGKLASSIANYKTEDEEGEPVDQPYMKTEYQYYGNGDLKELKVSLFNPFGEGEFELASIRKFEQYDNKPNPLAQLSFLNMGFFANLSTRNALLEKAYDADGNLEETIQNQFTYDGQGFPLTCATTTTPVGGTPEVTNMKFFYN